MKYHQIRARRAEGSAVSAPEYAVNCLNVDILFAKGRTDVRELSVRLYTSAYRLMGVAARQAFSGKAIRTWHFEVSSSDAWTGGTYRAFVFFTRAKALIRVPVWKAWSLLRPKCSLPGGWLSGRGGLLWKTFILTRISSSVSLSKSGSLRKI